MASVKHPLLPILFLSLPPLFHTVHPVRLFSCSLASPAESSVTMETGGMLSSVAGWRYARSPRPLCSAWGSSFSPEPLNNDWGSTPPTPPVSLYICRSYVYLTSLTYSPSPPLSEVVRLKLKSTPESLPPEWVITGRRHEFHLPSPANASLSARFSTASHHRTHSASFNPVYLNRWFAF